MKKNIRRVLSICLAVVLMLSMAVVASAASVYYNYDGGLYKITVTKGSRNDFVKVIPGATSFEHTYGNVTPHMDNRAYSETIRIGVPNIFTTQVLVLLDREGLRSSCTAEGNTGNIYYYAEVYDATGTYKLGVRIEAYRATWAIELDTPSSTGTNYPSSSGSYEQAPTGRWFIEPMKVA